MLIDDEKLLTAFESCPAGDLIGRLQAVAAAALQAAREDFKAVGYLTRNDEGDPAMLFFDPDEALKYCGEGEEPEPLGLMPGITLEIQ